MNDVLGLVDPLHAFLDLLLLIQLLLLSCLLLLLRFNRLVRLVRLVHGVSWLDLVDLHLVGYLLLVGLLLLEVIQVHTLGEPLTFVRILRVRLLVLNSSLFLQKHVFFLNGLRGVFDFLRWLLREQLFLVHGQPRFALMALLLTFLTLFLAYFATLLAALLLVTLSHLQHLLK